MPCAWRARAGAEHQRLQPPIWRRSWPTFEASQGRCVVAGWRPAGSTFANQFAQARHQVAHFVEIGASAATAGCASPALHGGRFVYLDSLAGDRPPFVFERAPGRPGDRGGSAPGRAHRGPCDAPGAQAGLCPSRRGSYSHLRTFCAVIPFGRGCTGLISTLCSLGTTERLDVCAPRATGARRRVQQGVAVGRRLGHQVGADHRIGAGLVVHHRRANDRCHRRDECAASSESAIIKPSASSGTGERLWESRRVRVIVSRMCRVIS